MGGVAEQARVVPMAVGSAWVESKPSQREPSDEES